MGARFYFESFLVILSQMSVLKQVSEDFQGIPKFQTLGNVPATRTCDILNESSIFRQYRDL